MSEEQKEKGQQAQQQQDNQQSDDAVTQEGAEEKGKGEESKDGSATTSAEEGAASADPSVPEEGKQEDEEGGDSAEEHEEKKEREPEGEVQGENHSEGDNAQGEEEAADEDAQNAEFEHERVPDIQPGMTVRVYQKIKDITKKGEERERLQVFEGIVLARSHGKEAGATITVRKVSNGVGVEKIFPLHSPMIDRIEVLKQARVRRAKLFFLRRHKKKLKEKKVVPSS